MRRDGSCSFGCGWSTGLEAVGGPLAAASAERSLMKNVSVRRICTRDIIMNGIIYLVGLIVIIMFILSFLGLR